MVITTKNLHSTKAERRFQENLNIADNVRKACDCYNPR